MSTVESRRFVDPNEYNKNREAFTEEQLAPYEGQWVAFSMDGKRIIAAAPDLIRLDQKVKDIGENPEQVALEFIDGRSEFIDVGGIQFG